MIDLLTWGHYADYDPNLRPSKQGGAGGMQSKTARTLEVLQTYFPGSRVVTEVDDIRSTVVLIEPLRFTLGDFDSVDKLEWIDAKKIMYGGEFAPLRLSPSERDRFFRHADAVTYHSEFLKNLFKYIGIKAKYLLTEIVPDLFHPGEDPAKREKQIIAMGSVSMEKNSGRVIEIFKRLKGEAKRVYIGSGSLWGEGVVNEKLEDELFDNCDEILSDATPVEVAEKLRQSKVGLWCAIHDTWSNCVHEMIASGVPVVSSCHGLAAELPVRKAVNIDSQLRLVHEVLDMPIESYCHESDDLYKWSQANVSPAVFIEQLRHILRSI